MKRTEPQGHQARAGPHFYAHLGEALFFPGLYHEAMNCYSHAMQMPDEAFKSYEPTHMRDSIEQMMAVCSSRLKMRVGEIGLREAL